MNPGKNHSRPRVTRCRSFIGMIGAICAVVGATAGPAGAVNAFVLDSSPDGRAAITVDNSGNGYFAWEHKASSTNDVTEFCKVARGGVCPSPIVLPTPPLSPPPNDSTDVSAAFPILGPGSIVYVVGPRFIAADVVVWTSTDGGQSFGPAVQVVPTGGYPGGDPTSVLAAGGGFDISSHNPGLYFTSVPTSGSAADLTPAAGSTNISGSTLGLASGSPVEAYSLLSTDPQTIGFRSYTGSGDVNDPANWTAPAQVTAGVLPHLAGGPKGLFLASQDAVNGKDTQVNVRRYSGSGFGTPVAVQSNTSADNIGTIFQTAGSGQLLVAWEGPTAPNGGIGIRLYRSTNAGTSFTNVGDVAEGTPNYATYPDSLRIAAADDGHGFLSFLDAGGGQQLLRVADLNPIPELATGTASIRGSAITTTVTVNTAGTLAATASVINGAALAAARRHGCRKGQVLVRAHGQKRCVSDSFGAMTTKLRAAGRHTIALRPNAVAKRALARGKTLRVREMLAFTAAAGGGKPILRTFTVTVHATSAHKKH